MDSCNDKASNFGHDSDKFKNDSITSVDKNSEQKTQKKYLPLVKGCKKEIKHCNCCQKFEGIREGGITAKVAKQMNKKLRKCDNCPYETKNSTYFRDHMQTHKPQVCELCGFEAKNQNAQKVHFARNHKTLSACDICDYKSKRPYSIQKHKQTVHEGFRIPCDQCEKKFTQHNDLNNHMFSAHGIPINKNIRCNECDFNTVYRQVMTYHKKKKHVQEKFK